MKLEVGKNTKRNMIVGLINKVILLILPFFSKSIINTTLGTEYLGLNSLFSSILSVLTLSELGFSSAMVYHMYKPIAEDNHKKINALLNLYRKAYLMIGIVISLVGVIIIPFLPFLVKGSYPSDINIYIIYVVQLINTSLSYFLFGYKQSLLVAYQRDDINSLINLITQGGMQILQLAILMLTKNYYYFIFIMPVFTVVNNLWIAYFTKKLFPFAKCEGKLEKDTLSSIKKLVAGSFIQKACATTRNSLDSICISSFVGLAITGIYNNYFIIFNGITVLLSIVGSSLAGGIGNHVVVKNKDENYHELEMLDFLYMMISGWCTVCLLCMSQTFMKFWMGKDMMLSISTVILMCIYFYMLKVGDMRGVYYNATGMWWEMRYRSIVETIANVILNVILGYFYGVNGIVLATVISMFFFNFLWGATIVFKNYFGSSKLKKYFYYHAKYAVITFIVCFISYFVASKMSSQSSIIELVERTVACILIPAILYLGIYCKTKLFKQSLRMVKKNK